MSDEVKTIGGAQVVIAHMMRAGADKLIALSYKTSSQPAIYLGCSEIEDLRPWIDEVLGKEPTGDDILARLLAEVKKLRQEARVCKDAAMRGSQPEAYHEGRRLAYNYVLAWTERAQAAHPQPEQPKAEPWTNIQIKTAYLLETAFHTIAATVPPDDSLGGRWLDEARPLLRQAPYDADTIRRLIEHALAVDRAPEHPKAEPWEPNDLAEEQARYDADTIKGLTAEIEAMLRHLLTLAGKQGETDTRLDEFAQWFSQWFSAIARELMRHDKRIEALDAKP